MAERTDRVEEQIKAALLKAVDSYWHDHTIILGSRSDKIRYTIEHLKRLSRDWGQPGRCMYHGCDAQSIRRSHTIHRAGSIGRIAENQHVLTPVLNNNGEMEMGRFGINTASTFPGFCVKHEQLFAEFENTGSITSERHVVLQAYRTLCREVARKDHEIIGLQRILEQRKTMRQEYLLRSIQETWTDAALQSVEVEGDEIEDYITTLLNGAKEAAAELRGDLHDELFEAISGQPLKSALQTISIPIEMSVSLSGLGELSYRRDCDSDQPPFQATCLLGVLPQNGSTLAFIGADRKHVDVVKGYCSWMANGFNSLNAIESWMINGSDHWFIRPSAWAAIPQQRQDRVLRSLMSDNENIGAVLDFSILDDARNAIVRMIEENDPPGVDRAKVLEMVTRERAKMT
jgi:hypothetical protein